METNSLLESALSSPRAEAAKSVHDAKTRQHMHPKRAKHGVKRTVIEHAHDGGHNIHHEMDDGTEQHHVAEGLPGLHANLDHVLGEADSGAYEGKESPSEEAAEAHAAQAV